MLRTPLKVLLIIAVIVGGTLFGLAKSGVAKPGTISWTQPDVEPCRRATAQYNPVLVQVRWIWSRKAYGWGCWYELQGAERYTITPMPK